MTATTAGGAGGVAIGPDDPFTVRWSPEAVQYAVKFPRAPLERQLGRHLQREITRPLRFDLGIDLTTPAGSTLLSAVAFLREQLGRPGGLATMPLAREQLESYVLSALLMAVPHDWSDALAEPGRPARRAHVQRVLDAVEADPARDLTVPELAAIAGVGSRALQAGFREHVGTTPSRYVRSVRLDRVRHDLVADAGRTPVTRIAARWGFFHASRFAAQYRARSGVTPSRTVELAAGGPEVVVDAGSTPAPTTGLSGAGRSSS